LSLITIKKIQVWISLVPTQRALMKLGLEVQIYSYHNQATTHSLYHSVHHLRVAHFCVTSYMSLLQSECLLHLHNILDTTDVASRWAEYAFKTLVPNRVLSHLAKVNEHSGLCGLSIARNSLNCSSSPPVHKDFARSVCLLWAKL